MQTTTTTTILLEEGGRASRDGPPRIARFARLFGCFEIPRPTRSGQSFRPRSLLLTIPGLDLEWIKIDRNPTIMRQGVSYSG